jgi:hypothetical protein
MPGKVLRSVLQSDRAESLTLSLQADKKNRFAAGDKMRRGIPWRLFVVRAHNLVEPLPFNRGLVEMSFEEAREILHASVAEH